MVRGGCAGPIAVLHAILCPLPLPEALARKREDVTCREYAGVTFAYAFIWAGPGHEFRRLEPGLRVAINQCNTTAGRIVLDATAVN